MSDFYKYPFHVYTATNVNQDAYKVCSDLKVNHVLCEGDRFFLALDRPFIGSDINFTYPKKNFEHKKISDGTLFVKPRNKQYCDYLKDLNNVCIVKSDSVNIKKYLYEAMIDHPEKFKEANISPTIINDNY